MAESKTLVECMDELEVVIRNNLIDIAKFMRKKEIIPKEMFDAVTDTRVMDRAGEKARELLRRLDDKVEEDKDIYKIFVDYLRTKDIYKKIVKTLDIKYAELSGSTVPSVQAVVVSHPFPDAVSQSRTELDAHHYGKLCGQLVQCASDWEKIAQNLDFLPYEIKNIRSDVRHIIGGPSSYLNDVLERWLSWAPGDQRKSADVATLEALRMAVDKAGYGRLAQELSI